MKASIVFPAPRSTSTSWPSTSIFMSATSGKPKLSIVRASTGSPPSPTATRPSCSVTGSIWRIAFPELNAKRSGTALRRPFSSRLWTSSRKIFRWGSKA